MALNPSTNATMAGRVTAADTNYPYASSKDESSPGAGDGMPHFKARADDILGFQQALLKAANITPSGNADTVPESQYLQSLVELASGRAFNYDDSGIADAYVLDVQTNQQEPQSYFDGMICEFIAGNSNTGASTVDVAGLGVVNIVDTGVAGTIVAGARIKLRYRTGTGDFEILVTGAPSIASAIRTITGTVAASALTLGLAADTLTFRNATIGNGSVNTYTFADLSLIVPSGATLGTVDTIQSRLVLLAIDNAGTVELAVVNQSGGNNLDETTLISTVAIDATADLVNVIYSTAARTNVPFRVVGVIESTQAVAGTWNTAPSTLQGAGGNALTAMQSIGYGQTLQDLTGSRAFGVTYYNNTGKPIEISVGTGQLSANAIYLYVSINGGAAIAFGSHHVGGGAALIACSGSIIIPPGASYVVTRSSTATLHYWSELR